MLEPCDGNDAPLRGPWTDTAGKQTMTETAGRGPAPKLTRRERDVLGCIAERLTNAEIADELTLSKRTVESYVSTLYVKLGVSTRRGLVRAAQQLEIPFGPASEDGAPRGPRGGLPPGWWAQTIALNRHHSQRASLQVTRGYARVQQAGARVAAARHFLATVAGMPAVRRHPDEPPLD